VTRCCRKKDLAMRINLSILLSITAAALLTGCAAIRPA
jgi:hypothetical protein